MKIQEISKRFSLSSPTLRYYEQIGLIEPVPKVNNRRDYNENHVDQIQFVLCMKQTGLSLEEIQAYTHLYLAGPETKDQRLTILEQQKAETLKKIQELQTVITYIDKKIESVEEE